MDMAIKHKHIKAVIQLRRALEEEWVRVDPILRVGEPALSTDIYKLKIGDGIHQWHELEYLTDKELRELEQRTTYTAGNGLVVEDNEFALDDLILDCGTSTTVI